MMQHSFYIPVREDGSPELEEVPNLGTTALPLYTNADDAPDSKRLESMSASKVVRIINEAEGFDHVRLYGSGESHLHPNSEIAEFLRGF